MQAYLADPSGAKKLPVARCLHEFLVLNDRLELERSAPAQAELLSSIAEFSAKYRDYADESCASFAQYFMRMFPEMEAGPSSE